MLVMLGFATFNHSFFVANTSLLAVNSGKYRSAAVEYGDVNLHLAS